MTTKRYEYEMEMLTAQMTNIERALANLMQSPPSVSGKASALVALAKSERLDGTIGPGRIAVSIGIAAGSMAIGTIGAAAIKFGNLDIMSTGQVFGYITLSGCFLGMSNITLDAFAVPMLWTEFLDWAGERWQEWRADRKEIALAALATRTVERPVMINPQDADDLPAPEIRHIEHADRIIVIKKATPHTEPVEWTYGRLWYFIEDCYQSGVWSRAKTIARWRQQFGGGALTQGEHKAVYDFIQKTCPPTAKSPGLWGLTGQDNRPTLEAYLTRFRWTPNRPTSQPANQPEENHE